MEQSQLFNLEPPILSWLPDESLFSLMSRLHRFWGYSHADSSSRVLFARNGHGKAELPSRIGLFAERTQGLLGGAESIAVERTLYAYHASLLAPELRATLLSAMCGGIAATSTGAPRALVSRMRYKSIRKACARCLEEDQRAHGVAYWHLSHQYPGVWICPQHQTLLLKSVYQPDKVARRYLYLPSLEHLQRPLPDHDHLSEAQHGALLRLTNVIVGVVKAMQHYPTSHQLLLNAHLATLRKREWLDSVGNFRRDKIAPSLTAFVAPLRCVPQMEGFRANLDSLLPRAQPGLHPLRHFVFIAWLYGDTQTFLAALNRE